MGEATTTNPWLVSLINMTLVFIVLIVLWGIMHVLYMVDPTKKKEEKKEAAPAPVVEEVAAPAEEEVAAVAAATEAAPEAEEAPAAAPAAAPAPKKAAPAGATTVAAPMPGKISKINFKAGDAVKSGDVLIMLEAMKMQNEIMAPCDGTVT